MRAARGIPRAACAPRATLRARPPAPPVSRPPKPRNAMPHWPPPGGERSGRPARAVGAGAARGYGAPHPTRVPAARVPRRLANVGHRPLNERSRRLAGPPMASARAGRAPAERARAARARRARAPRPARAATAAGQGAPPLGASSEAPARPSMASGACRACAQRVPGVRAAHARRTRRPPPPLFPSAMRAIHALILVAALAVAPASARRRGLPEKPVPLGAGDPALAGKSADYAHFSELVASVLMLREGGVDNAMAAIPRVHDETKAYIDTVALLAANPSKFNASAWGGLTDKQLAKFGGKKNWTMGAGERKDEGGAPRARAALSPTLLPLLQQTTPSPRGAPPWRPSSTRPASWRRTPLWTPRPTRRPPPSKRWPTRSPPRTTPLWPNSTRS